MNPCLELVPALNCWRRAHFTRMPRACVIFISPRASVLSVTAVLVRSLAGAVKKPLARNIGAHKICRLAIARGQFNGSRARYCQPFAPAQAHDFMEMSLPGCLRSREPWISASVFDSSNGSVDGWSKHDQLVGFDWSCGFELGFCWLGMCECRGNAFGCFEPYFGDSIVFCRLGKLRKGSALSAFVS